ncbi:Ser/Thr protein phosphatase, putative [Trichomonas vaginalis G3]|uniref:Serine/threonine-protein phosphatase n=1 Tax=Trichomonas vaginalis (strain ATCC PRA-98 / G3) TaxID=412133 RepID=A2FCP4_TRIV3|nr:phosphoprotein phosphatase protein [Trichomonas vaginalis G3]EAX97319.1 Ser/Thr protein phosphatase, putative [Trichomonas vaginalis G3]KAI5527000.1 phosphoprotein phosphatase protein [Trichomonas vaginalis G3]|eukprot:XP_001310249.1 Ser/Thr protein phosphatase [Trichomonas vaginalis G3]
MSEDCIAQNIVQLIGHKKIRKRLQKLLTKDYLLWLNSTVTRTFSDEPNILYLEGKFVLVGDLHGQFDDLDRILQRTWSNQNLKFVFLGDYVDRGRYSLEVISLLFTLKVMHPDRFILLRGNHECEYMTTHYGFKEECISKQSSDVYESFVNTFKHLPLCAILNNKVFCVHGGISKYIEYIDEITKIDRFCDVYNAGPMYDLLWADPDEDVTTFGDSDRGDTFVFGLQPALEFLDKNNLSILVRAHECVDNGFEYPFEYKKHEGRNRVLTLFSASDYIDYENDAAYAVYENKMEFHSLPFIKQESSEKLDLNNSSLEKHIMRSI